MPINESIQTESAEPRFNRRRLLQIGGGALLLGGAVEAMRRLGVFESQAPNAEMVRKMEEEALEKRDAFAREYLADPNLSREEIAQASDVFVRNELVRYLHKHPDNIALDHDTFIGGTYRPFMDGVKESFAARQAEADPADPENADTKTFGTPTVAMIANAKLALYDRIGQDPHYWGKQDTVIDPMLTAELQCRSGSRLLLLALHENAAQDLQPGERLVTIYSNTHVQTGLLTADGRVVAFEMTTSGKGIQDMGPMKDITAPVQILDAGHDLAQAAINAKAHPKETVLLDTVPAGFVKNDEIFGKTGTFGGGKIALPTFRFGVGGSTSGTTDQYGFGDGTVEVPEDRRPINSMDYLPSRMSTSNASSNRQGAATETGGNGVYDTLQSAEDSVGIDAARLMTPEERRAVQAFESHNAALSPELTEISSSYKRILRVEEADVGQEVQDIIASGQRLIAYMEANGLDEKYEAYEAAVTSFGRRNPRFSISYPRNPREYLISVLDHLKRLSSGG